LLKHLRRCDPFRVVSIGSAVTVGGFPLGRDLPTATIVQPFRLPPFADITPEFRIERV